MPNTIRTATLGEARRRASREAIVRVATELLRDDGAAAVTINEVARRLGIRPPSLYSHVSGKDAILDALFLQEAAALWQTAEPLGRIGDPRARLLAIGDNYYEWAMAHKRSYQLLFERPLPHFIPSAEAVAMNTHGRYLLQQAFRELAPGGALDVEAATLLHWTLVHGVCSLQIANTPEAGAYDGPFGETARHLLRQFMPAWLDRVTRGEAMLYRRERDGQPG